VSSGIDLSATRESYTASQREGNWGGQGPPIGMNNVREFWEKRGE
jgi:hypothetical protein